MRNQPGRRAEKKTGLDLQEDIMKTGKIKLWFFLHLQCLLTVDLVDSSSLPSTRSLSITSMVGSQAVLPCSWKDRLGEAPAFCHVQWATLSDTVFEQRGDDRYQAAEFRGRVKVPEEQLGSGDCSLIISDVQIGDTGRYESFMVVDGQRSRGTRVFIQSVKLSVFDHKSHQSGRPGGDLVVDLHTPRSVRLVFQGRNSSVWSDMWMRGDKNTWRLEKHPLLEQLTIRNLKRSDEGTYKVLDGQGLAVSTVQLSVEENSTAARVNLMLENRPTDAAVHSSCSHLLLVSLLVWSFHILHVF
uniref:Immunoglobulin domain-containing protein n=1 Tax=Amphiprion percula TaxID=161767 RepID=A0A3P8S007_AMPPE